MTELREQLLTAKNEYRSARYPGDLAAELLPPAAVARAAVPPPWGMRAFVVRLAGVAVAAAAVVALVVVRPPDRMSDPRPDARDSRVPPRVAVSTGARPAAHAGWWFAPDLTFASAAAERVKTVATRVQMRMTLPYRDLRMPELPDFPSLPWLDWSRDRRSSDDPASPADTDVPPRAGPSTQQAA